MDRIGYGGGNLTQVLHIAGGLQLSLLFQLVFQSDQIHCAVLMI